MKDSLTLAAQVAISACVATGFRSVKISVPSLAAVIAAGDKSVAQIAREVGISAGSIFNWLKKDEVAGIDPELLPKLAETLGVEPQDLKAGGGVLLRVDHDIYTELKARAMAAKKSPAEYLATLFSPAGRAADAPQVKTALALKGEPVRLAKPETGSMPPASTHAKRGLK
jgi:transposase-like protein